MLAGLLGGMHHPLHIFEGKLLSLHATPGRQISIETKGSSKLRTKALVSWQGGFLVVVNRAVLQGQHALNLCFSREWRACLNPLFINYHINYILQLVPTSILLYALFLKE